MSCYSSLADDWYVNMHLNTEMELPANRETILHFFEQLQRRYPSMRNFFARQRGDFILEEDKDQGAYRWCTVEARRVCSGYVNPPCADEAIKQHLEILEIVPYALSVSPLDCEALDLLYGFDFTYRGNHNELVAEVLGVSPAFEKLLSRPGIKIVDYEPVVTLAFDEDCQIQARLSVETRTLAYHIRTCNYPEEQLSVYLTARRYGNLSVNDNFADVLKRLDALCRELLEQYVIEDVLKPLARTIGCN